MNSRWFNWILKRHDPGCPCVDCAPPVLPQVTRRAFIGWGAALVGSIYLPKLPAIVEPAPIIVAPEIAIYSQTVRISGVTSSTLGELLKNVYDAKSIEALQNLESAMRHDIRYSEDYTASANRFFGLEVR